VKSKNVIVVSSNETPVQGFEKLLKNNILSAPVFDEATQKYVGFLDIRDLVSYTVFAFNNRNTVAYQAPGPIYHTLIDNVTVTYLARRNPFLPVHPDQTLLEVAEILANGVHRVPVVDESGKLISIISQSNLIAYLNLHLDGDLREEVQVKIKDAQLGTSPVISVSKNVSTIDTFQLMDNTKKNAVAIVSTTGTLMGNISGRDLKLFIESSCSYDILSLSIFEFLTKIRNESEIDIRTPSISCNLNETLYTVVKKLAATGVHRLYIVNSSEDYTPVRVISLTDILKYLLKR